MGTDVQTSDIYIFYKYLLEPNPWQQFIKTSTYSSESSGQSLTKIK